MVGGMGVVAPIVKKAKGKNMEDYRRVTTVTTLYKIYAAMMADRLREEVEREEIIPPNQMGFRRGMGTIDNIYILNYIINRQIEKKRGK